MITRAFFLLVVVLGAFDLPINSILVKSAGIQQRNNNNNNNITITNNPIGCNACRMHEEIRALSLKAIKEQILNKLGLKQAPNMTGRSLPRIPPLSKLMDMYGMQADQPQSSHELGITHHDETDEFSAKTESVFVLAQPHKKLRHSKSSLDVLYFKFSDKIIQHRVMRAELSVWILGTKVSETIKGNESFTEKFDKSDEIVSTSFFIPRNTENTDIINNYHGQNDKNIETRNNENKEITEDGEVVVVGDGDTHSDGDSEGDSEDGGGEGGDDDDDNDDDDDDEDDDDDNDDSDSATNNPSNKKNNKNRGRIIITLQRILRGTDENGGPLLGSPLTTRHKRPIGTHGTWITIELRRMVAEWFKHPRDNLGVAIKINNENNNINNNNNNDNNKNNNNNSNNNNKNSKRKKSNNYNNLPIIEINPNADHAPYLEVQTQELDNKRGTRIKRNVGLNCDESSQETRCCRYKLTVDFEKFGWDWIIAPKKYDANYCSGDCPMAFLPAYPNTHIVSLAEPPNNTGPCCAPRKLSEITMLYFDNEYQIVFSRLPGMVVERCGCS